MLPFDLPWGGDDDADGDDAGDARPDAVVVCEFQDGTLVVSETEVTIERVSRSKFADKTIGYDQVSDVEYESGITIGYLQVVQHGVEPDAGGMLSDPVNENTVHFSRGGRECAREARDAILERARG